MSAGYYKKKQEILQKKACERYEDLYEKDKNKKHQYACKRYRKLSEEEKYGQYDHKEYNNFPDNEK